MVQGFSIAETPSGHTILEHFGVKKEKYIFAVFSGKYISI